MNNDNANMEQKILYNVLQHNYLPVDLLMQLFSDAEDGSDVDEVIRENVKAERFKIVNVNSSYYGERGRIPFVSIPSKEWMTVYKQLATIYPWLKEGDPSEVQLDSYGEAPNQTVRSCVKRNSIAYTMLREAGLDIPPYFFNDTNVRDKKKRPLTIPTLMADCWEKKKKNEKRKQIEFISQATLRDIKGPLSLQDTAGIITTSDAVYHVLVPRDECRFASASTLEKYNNEVREALKKKFPILATNRMDTAILLVRNPEDFRKLFEQHHRQRFPYCESSPNQRELLIAELLDKCTCRLNPPLGENYYAMYTLPINQTGTSRIRELLETPKLYNAEYDREYKLMQEDADRYGATEVGDVFYVLDKQENEYLAYTTTLDVCRLRKLVTRMFILPEDRYRLFCYRWQQPYLQGIIPEGITVEYSFVDDKKTKD